MGKKKSKKKNTNFPNWDKQKHLKGIIKEQDWEFITQINKQTTDHLGPTWIENLKTNAPLWSNYGNLHDLKGLGKNKSVIGIGAGPSFNKNKGLLKTIISIDGTNEWEDKDFINHCV